MSRDDELRTLTSRWNDAWNSRDAGQLAVFFSTGATYYEPEFAAPRDGATAVAEAARQTWAEWPEASFEAVSVTVDAPRVVLEWRSSATHSSGRTLNLEGVDVLEWEGDRLTAARVYYDVHARVVALRD